MATPRGSIHGGWGVGEHTIVGGGANQEHVYAHMHICTYKYIYVYMYIYLYAWVFLHPTPLRV